MEIIILIHSIRPFDFLNILRLIGHGTFGDYIGNIKDAF
jgi:hypothetical protein